MQSYPAINQRAITFVIKYGLLLFFGQLTFNTAQVYRANAQVRSNIMLGHPLHHLWFFLYQIQVALLGRIFYKGKELFHLLKGAPKYSIQDHLPEYRQLTYLRNDPVCIFFMNVP